MKIKFIISALALFISSSAFAQEFKVTSPQIKDNQMLSNNQVFNGFGCSGKNISPEIAWTGAPQETKSFAITVYDPDAPTGSGWWHWTVFNISPQTKKIPLGWSNDPKRSPLGIQGRTDFGTSSFGGACPPEGDKHHHYIVTVYALKVDQIPLKEDASGALVGYYLNQNKIAEAKLTGLYSR